MLEDENTKMLKGCNVLGWPLGENKQLNLGLCPKSRTGSLLPV